MRSTKFFFCLLFMVAGIIFAGCSNLFQPVSPKKDVSITITDATGRNVTLPKTVKTYALSTFDLINFIIPLKGEAAFEMLVGVGDSGGKWSYDNVYEAKFPQWKDRWTIISPHNAPFDLEAILAKKPDVLIVNSAMQAHLHALDIEPQLTKAGIALVLVDVPQNVDRSAQETYTLMGKIFNEEEKAAEVNAFLDKQFKVVKDGLANVKRSKPLVYYEKSGTAEVYGPSKTSKTSGWGALINYAGGDNLADHAAGKSMKGGVMIDPEFVINADPDFIILSDCSRMGMGFDLQAPQPNRFNILLRPGWQNIKAVKNKEVYEFHHELNRTPFLFYPVQCFAKSFYPEAFQSLDPEKQLDEFYDRFMLIKRTDGLWKIKME